MTSRKNQLFRQIFTGVGILILSWGAVSCSAPAEQNIANKSEQPSAYVSNEKGSNEQAAAADNLSTAIFAGGCFWCMEKPFDELPGVVSTTSGYTGGTVENPTYGEVSSGGTGHYEAMEVKYDPKQVSYEKLLDTFWVNVDPLDSKGQFCDKGDQYRSAIFYENPEQQQLATASKTEVAQQLDAPIATDILPAAPFYDAEDYHQNYYRTHAVRYKIYRYGCGRDQRLSEVWKDAAPAHE